MKRITSLILTLIIFAGTLQFTAFAADGDSLSYGSFTYTVTDSEVTITALDSGVTGSIIIPASIDNLPVTSIGGGAFDDCSLVTQVTMPTSIKSVGSGALTGLINLERFYYTGTLNQWCSISFTGGSTPFNLTDNVFIDGRPVDQIRAYNWNGLKEIKSYSFYGCKTLTVVEFPESLETIGEHAFSDCVSISRLLINAGISSIKDTAFDNCSGIESITVSQYNETYCSYGNCLIDRNRKKLLLGCKNSVIPSDGSVTVIGSNAFRGCTGLESLTIPEGVTSVASGTVFVPIGVWGAFSGCENLREITFPESVESIGGGAFYNCISLETVNMPAVTSIGSHAFGNCISLTEITLPETVEEINGGVFSKCTSLKTINYKAKNAELTSQTWNWLNGCKSLENLVIGKNVQSIPASAFKGVDTIKTITLYNTLESIGKNAFSGCNSLSRINFYGTPEEWMENYNGSFQSNAFIREIYYLSGLCIKTDDESNVTVQYQYGTFGTPNDSELTLNVEDIEENDARFSAFKAYIDGSQVALYEIHMKNADNENMQPLDENKVTVKIPLPYAIDPSKYDTVFIHHRKQDGKTERIKFLTGDLAIEDGFFIFEIDSFSDFAVCVDDGGNHIDEDGDYICDLCRESLTYTVKLIVDGVNLGDIIYHYGDTEIDNLPNVPEKAGYTGRWEYTITGSELDIKPVYETITYYAAFIADGSEIAKIPFTVEDKYIDAPAVPAKEGFTGSWSEYTLAASDITVNAVYTEINEPENPENPATPCAPATQTEPDTPATQTEPANPATPDSPATKTEPVNPATPDSPATQTEPFSPTTPDSPATQTEPVNPDNPDTPEPAVPDIAIKNYTEKLTVDYKSALEFHAILSSALPDGYKIVWSTGDEGTTCTINQTTEKEYKISAKIVKISDNSTVKTTKEETVTVNTGFFAKIIAFFRSLFKSLPVYVDNKKTK